MIFPIKIAAVVFDMDGVIFDSENLCLKCWREIAAKYDLGDITDEFMKCTGTTKELTKQIMTDFLGDEDLYDKFASEASLLFHMYEDRDGLPVKKGVNNLLEALKERKIRAALASSTRLAVVEAELKTAGFYDYFEVVIGGDMVKNSKPDPEIYLTACNRLGLEPGMCAAVEDSYNGIRSAYAAGMKTVMVPDLLPATDEMREKSIIIAEDLDELVPLFEKTKD